MSPGEELRQLAVDLRRERDALEGKVARLEADLQKIGDRAWNCAIERCITELRNMKWEDAQRLADRIRDLRTPNEGGGADG